MDWAGLLSLGGLVGSAKQGIDHFSKPVEDYVASQKADSALAVENSVNRANYDMQKEFATHGIRWRVEDAKAAGIHPLYAIGASGASASPSFQMPGQDLSRAIHATRTGSERQIAELAMQRAQLENIALGLQVYGLAKSQFGPPMPELYDPKPSQTVKVDPDAPGREPGDINDFAYVRRGDAWYPTKAKDVTERTEDDVFQQSAWAFRNQILPLFADSDAKGGPVKPPAPPFMKNIPEGKEWHWNGVYYRLVKKGKPWWKPRFRFAEND